MPTWTAIAPPGLEPVVSRELELLGETPQQSAGHVQFTASLERGAVLSGLLRTPTRLLLQVGNTRARTYEELAQRLRSMDWTPYLRPRDDVHVVVRATRSRLKHRTAVEKKAANAIQDSLKGRPLPPSRARRPRRTQRVQVHIANDQATVSIDVAGDLLHMRGWRREAGKAPLRENLAACLLFASGWSPEEPLMDPFCGSGTIPIEAALLAAGKPPGPRREFAWEAWPKLVGKALRWPSVPAQPAQIFGADHNERAIEISGHNARRAGVSVQFQLSEVEALLAPAPTGLIVANPPYGERLGNHVLGVYSALGRLLEGPFAGWRVAFLAPHPELAVKVHPDVMQLTTFKNGGLPVGLYGWEPANEV